MTQIKAILFDKDGTLFDQNKTWANWWREFLLDMAGRDVSLARKLGEAVGFELDFAAFHSDSTLASHTPHDVAKALLPLLPGASLAGIVTRMSTMSATVAQAEATPLLPLMDELVRRGLRLGVVTNDLEQPTRSHLREASVETAFEHIIACDSGFAAKPAPDMLLAFCEFTGIDPRYVVMVGDSMQDMVAARACGMPCVAVLTGVATRHQLEPAASAVLPSIAGLPKWLTERDSDKFAA
ncbi:HAD family hydrolase [Meridianimarinicoccus aquatilis]|uniref:phosphoglycolate phosphatase n=1 Tax=Meridianimarinicoccus aquatilis TaxID=2552766 RepID=A0A4R6B062_9RHOB|nr:HAD family hydrolase [Fluviibacterium aquatile]QIE41941.1 HAD family hydrolase [Rhodobacteraceae bacterium SC52]TDL87833.1 HAD family hydrolase [Fluviibacterium aquatile]